MENTEANAAFDRFEELLSSDYGSEEAGYAIEVMRDAGTCMLALGMLAGFEHANRRTQGAAENLGRAAVAAKLVAA